MPAPAWRVPLVAALTGTGLTVARLQRGMLQTYEGGNGGHLGAPNERLEVVLALRRFVGGEVGALDTLRAVDAGYPPLVHLVTSALVAPFGHAPAAVQLSGWLWVLLLAWAVGRTAAELAPGGPQGVVGVRAAAAAASVVLLLGGLQAFALRYYYDLPMAALLQCAVVALLVAGDRTTWGRVLRRGALAGLLLWLACLCKWTALPLAVVTGAGVALRALTGTRGRRAPRLWALAAAGITTAALMGAWLAGTVTELDPGSFLEMSKTFAENPTSLPLPPWMAAALPLGLENSLEIAHYQLKHGGWLWRDFYPRWIVWSILSPAGALFCAGLGLVWLLRGAPGGTVLQTTVWGHWLFLMLLVPPLDERFFLPAAMATLVGAALGLAMIPGRLGAWIAGCGGLLFVGLAVDFHFGGGPRLDEFDRSLTDGSLRSWHLRSASDPDGAWARGDEPGFAAATLREGLMAAVHRCDVLVVAVGAWDPQAGQEYDAPVITDSFWWSWLGLQESVVLGRPQLRVLRASESFETTPDGTSLRADLYVAPWDGQQAPSPPPGPPPELLTLLQTLAPSGDFDGGAALFRPRDAPPCAP